MELAELPPLIVQPFGAGNLANVTVPFPQPSQTGVAVNKASLNDGFPPATLQPESSGGLPPFGQDTNGILYLITQNINWQNAGGLYPFNAAFCTFIGGYPKGALLARVDGTGFWLCTQDDNTNNPETTATGWFPISNAGATTLALTNANVTLTPTQYAKKLLILTGALTGNVTITFPKNQAESWVVLDLTSPGAYSTTLSTGTGHTITSNAETNLPHPPQLIVCDGTQLLSPFENIALTGIPTAPTAAPGTNTTQIATMAALLAAIGGFTAVQTVAIVDASGNYETRIAYFTLSGGGITLKFVVGNFGQIASRAPTNYAPGSTFSCNFNEVTGTQFNIGNPIFAMAMCITGGGTNPTAMDIESMSSTNLVARVVTGTNTGPSSMNFSFIAMGS